MERWTTPRTPDGRPDLQGIWTTQTFTPLQRPDRFAGQEFLTAQGVDPVERRGVRASPGPKKMQRNDVTSRCRPDLTHYDNAMWLRTQRPKGLSSRRTSLIVDPPDGKIPPRTPEAQQRAAAQLERSGYDSYANRPLAERCLVWAQEGPPRLPPPYNDIYQIFQVPGYVVLFPELAEQPRPHHPHRRPAAPSGTRSPVVGRLDWPMGWRHADRRYDQLHRPGRLSGLRRGPPCGRAIYPRRCRHGSVRVHARRPDDLGAALERGDPDGSAATAGSSSTPYHEGNYGMRNTLRGARAADRRAAAEAVR